MNATIKLLLIVDVQNDFLEAGSIPVANSNAIIAPINQLIRTFSKDKNLVWATGDNHPVDHVSFAKTFSKPNYTLQNGRMLWPVHCVKNSCGQKFSQNLLTGKIQRVFLKGGDKHVDSFSGIADDNGMLLPLYYAIKKANITHVYIVGLAFEYCVISTISDIIKYFPRIKIVCDMKCTRAIDSSNKSMQKLMSKYHNMVYFHNYEVIQPVSNLTRGVSQHPGKTVTVKPYLHKKMFAQKLHTTAWRQLLYALATVIAIGILITIIIFSSR